MKTKEEAAKLLLEAGWTLEEVLQVIQVSNAPIWFYYPSHLTWPPPVITWKSSDKNTVVITDSPGGS